MTYLRASMLDALETEVDKLERHLLILSLVLENHPIGISRLAQQTDYAKHEVRYSLRKLEDEDLIEPTSNGAIPTDHAASFLQEHEARLDGLIRSLEEIVEHEQRQTVSGPEA